jgi:hypothetical protein
LKGPQAGFQGQKTDARCDWQSPGGKLKSAICALARAAFMFRGVLIEAAEGSSIEDILAQREEALRVSNRVLNKWCEHLGIDQEQAGASN